MMNYSIQSYKELVANCKKNGIKGYSGKNKQEIIELLMNNHIETKEHIPIHIQNYKIISLFSGMCGMDIGFAEQVIVHKNSVSSEYIESQASIDDFVNLKRLPFDVVFQNDILPEAKKIAELNGWNHNYHLKDIRDMIDEKFVFPDADVVIGGFPCQDFSHAGKRKGFDSSRGTLYQSFVDVVKITKPLVFVAENVNGLLTMKGEPIKQIISDFSNVGYEVKYQLLKSEEYGIPQTRWRVIIIGVRLDKIGNLSDNWNVIDENKLKCTVRSYFNHLQEPNTTCDPAQQVYSKAIRRDKGQGQKEVGLDEFSPTIRAEHHGNIEFRRIVDGKNNENSMMERRLTVREAALIQTFPPSCILTEQSKPSSKAYKPIGNAVPPLLAYIIAKKVLTIIKTMNVLTSYRITELEYLREILENKEAQRGLVMLYSQSQSECTKNGVCGMEIGMAREKDQGAVLKLFMKDKINIDVDNTLVEDYVIGKEKISAKHSGSKVGSSIKAKWTSADMSVQEAIKFMINAEDTYYPHLLITYLDIRNRKITIICVSAEHCKNVIKELKEDAFTVPSGNSRGIEYSKLAMTKLFENRYFTIEINDVDLTGGTSPIERRINLLISIGITP